jgi:hypothetical protein
MTPVAGHRPTGGATSVCKYQDEELLLLVREFALLRLQSLPLGCAREIRWGVAAVNICMYMYARPFVLSLQHRPLECNVIHVITMHHDHRKSPVGVKCVRA